MTNEIPKKVFVHFQVVFCFCCFCFWIELNRIESNWIENKKRHKQTTHSLLSLSLLKIQVRDETLLEEVLKQKHGFVIFKVPGDGNCLFRAIGRWSLNKKNLFFKSWIESFFF
jgi:hypothetical protein